MLTLTDHNFTYIHMQQITLHFCKILYRVSICKEKS
jgi:hypothetical protein